MKSLLALLALVLLVVVPSARAQTAGCRNGQCRTAAPPAVVTYAQPLILVPVPATCPAGCCAGVCPCAPGVCQTGACHPRTVTRVAPVAVERVEITVRTRRGAGRACGAPVARAAGAVIFFPVRVAGGLCRGLLGCCD